LAELQFKKIPGERRGVSPPVGAHGSAAIHAIDFALPSPRERLR
jgi:hypothetical protein